MNSMKCPQCGLVNWATADACKRCRLPFNGAEAPDAHSWEESPDGYAREPVYQLGDDGYHEASYGYAHNVDVAQKTGLAIASMVIGIVSMVACGLLGCFFQRQFAQRSGHAEPKPPAQGGSKIRMRFRSMRKESVSCSSEELRDTSRRLM